jgi:hypothetical protein
MAKNRGLPEERGPSGRTSQGAGAIESADLGERNDNNDQPTPKKAGTSPADKTKRDAKT